MCPLSPTFASLVQPTAKPPASPIILSVHRDQDARTATIRWKPVKGAVGYNVRWGTSAAHLDSTYQRFADQATTFDLRALSVGVDYVVAVEAFDEHGVSALSGTLAVAP